jgi:hypothetical protein
VTVDQLLEWARFIIDSNSHAYVHKETLDIAEAVMSQLGVGFPCSMAEPELDGQLVNWWGMLLNAEELRGIAQMLLRKADELEAL